MMPGMSIEQFKAGVSRIRNPVIAKTLGQLELIEEWGSGYKRIQDTCERDGYPLPEWEEFGSALRVTFYPHPEVAELGAEPGTKSAPSRHQVIEGLEIDNDMLKIIEFCREEKSLQAIMQHMDWKDRTKFSRRFISPLLEKGIIERTIPEKPRSSKQRYHITNHGLEVLHNKEKT